jgi:hypothetical protein
MLQLAWEYTVTAVVFLVSHPIETDLSLVGITGFAIWLEW